MFKLINFGYPYFLLLFLIFPILIIWYIYRNNKGIPTLKISTIDTFNNIKSAGKQKLYHILFALRLLALALLIIVLASPQTNLSKQDITVEGIDIVLSFDISPSMLSEDFKPNRIEAAKKVANEFIDGRPQDRIGLVIFAGESFTQCPLTTDHAVLKNLFYKINSDMLEDGTAIGMGLATAINRLKESKAKSKVIILLTDGVNNTGTISPMTSAELAKLYGIRVYTIGVGTYGEAPYPFKTPFGIQYQNIPVEIDEALLKDIAQLTNGKYYRATNNKKLREIYNDIDKLEKSKIEVTEYHRKKLTYLPWSLLAGIILFGELLLRYTVFKKIP